MKTTGGSAASSSPSPRMSTKSLTGRVANPPTPSEKNATTHRNVERAPAPPVRRPPSPTVNTWTVNGQLRASDTSTLTFRPPPAPWYRTKQATIALIAVVSAVVAVPFALRSGPQTGPEESTSVAPRRRRAPSRRPVLSPLRRTLPRRLRCHRHRRLPAAPDRRHRFRTDVDAPGGPALNREA